MRSLGRGGDEEDLLPVDERAMVVVDLTFGSYQSSHRDAYKAAVRVISETGCEAVKLEGGAPMLPQVEVLAGAGIPVIGHLGLTPQSVNLLGGYRVQGRGEAGEKLCRHLVATALATWPSELPEEL